MTKDINKYWDKYKEIYSFEEILKVYREKKAIEFLYKYKAKKILEIGCGFTPGFTKYKDFDSYTVVEPGNDAYKHACDLANGLKNIQCINDYFENCYSLIKDNQFDCIVSTGVLHETPTPEKFLKTIGKLLTATTSTYINVPNALSFHRIIAEKMGLIENVYQKTDRNIVLQQNINFDVKLLLDIIKNNLPNADIVECKTFFFKPFTHAQMMQCIENNIIDEKIIEGLYDISDEFPNNGSEIYCVFKQKKEV